MTTTHPAPAGKSAAPAALDALFPRWPEGPRTRGRRHPRLVGGALTVSLFAAGALPHREPGLALWLILVAGAGVVGATFWARARPDIRALGGVFVLLVSTVVLRDAGWMVSLCLLAAALVGIVALGRTRTAAEVFRVSFALSFAWLRGLPWLRRSLTRTAAGPRRLPTLRVVRTVVLSGGLLAVFASLFASADLVFAGWLAGLEDQLPSRLPPVSVAIFAGSALVILSAAYVGLNPPPASEQRPRPRRTLHRFEWVSPLAAVIAVFVVFLLAQLRTLFGGHRYLQRSGLSYADYVHQGFAQLIVASVLVLVLVAISLRLVPRRRRLDRRLMRGLLGALGAVSLVVVASALYRLQVYEAAYGFTRLRLLVSVFEAWLGLVLLLATTAGVWLRARWLPRVAVLAGVLMILVLTLANPDAMIAKHNVQRYAETHKIDSAYLRSLSADAVPALDRLPEPIRSCVLSAQPGGPSGGLDFNLGRARAAAVLIARPASWAGCREGAS